MQQELFVPGSTSDLLPSQTLSQWVSYAEQVVVARVASERRQEIVGETAEFGEGLVGREVTLEIERTIWSEPELRSQRSGAVTFTAAGWVLKDGKLSPLRYEGPRLEVGERVVLPLTTTPTGISPLTVHSVALLDADRAVLAPGQTDAVVRQLAGRSIADIAQELRTARPDPVAQRFRHLPPFQRSQAVSREEPPD